MMRRTGFWALVLAAALLATCILPVAIAESTAKYDPPIEVTFVRQTDDTIENNVIAKLDGETLEKNRWTDLIEQELGIQVKYLWITKGADQYTQKFNSSIASGQVPDIMLVNATQLAGLYDGGLLQPIGQAFDGNASDLLKQIVADAGKEALLAATFEGQLYGVPECNANLDSLPLLWLRSDWLEAYGLEAPKTVDEMVNVIKTFVDNTESGIGLAACKDLWDVLGFTGLFNSYGAYPRIWIEQDGKLVYGSVTAEMKPALEKLAEMYKAGLIDPEFTVKDSTKAYEAIVSGKSGAYFGAHWSPLYPLMDCVKQNPGADWVAMAVPSALDTPSKMQMNLGTANWYVVSAECEHPEALIKLLNLYGDKTFDPVKQEYTKYSNPGGGIEAVWKLSPVYFYTATKNLDNFKAVEKAFETGSTEGMFGEQLTMYEYCKKYVDGDPEMWGWNRVFGIGSSWNAVDDLNDEGRTILNAFAGAPGQATVDYKTTLDKAINEAVSKIIVGQETIDSFDDAIAAWYAAGGQEMTDEVNEWYASIK